MYYVPGQGYFEGEPLTYTNAQGQNVTQTSGLLRNSDGTLHKAYEFAPSGISGATSLERSSSPISGSQAKESGKLAKYNEAMAKWRRGESLTEEELAIVREYNAATASLSPVPTGGGRASTKTGKKTKTSLPSGYTSQTGNWQLI